MKQKSKTKSKEKTRHEQKAERFDLLQPHHFKKDIPDLQEKQREAYKKMLRTTAQKPMKKTEAFKIMSKVYGKKRNAKKNLKMFLANDNFDLAVEGRFVVNDVE